MIKKKVVELDNGLTVVLCKNDRLHSFGAEIFIKYGSAYKDFTSNNVLYKCEDGIAHLLEHVLIDNGCEGSIYKYFTDSYYTFNGVTSNEYTKFYIHGYEDFEEKLKEFIFFINDNKFTKEGVEKSKGPVLEEVKERSNNRFFDLNKARFNCLFNKDVVLSGVGEYKSVQDFSYDDVKLIYDTFYKPSNEIITVHGNFDMDKILKVIKDSFNKIDRVYRSHEIIPFEDDKEVKNKTYEINKEKDLELYNLLIKVPMDGYTIDEKERILKYLSWYFDYNFSSKSELYKEIIKEGISNYSVSCDDYYYPYGSEFLILSFTLPTSKGKEFVDMIFKELNNIKMPSDTKKKLYKRKMYFNRLINLDKSGYLAKKFATNNIYYMKNEFPSLEELDNYSFKEMENLLKRMDLTHYSIIHQKND